MGQIVNKPHQIIITIETVSERPDGSLQRNVINQTSEGCDSPGEFCYKAPRLSRAVVNAVHETLDGWADGAIAAMRKAKAGDPSALAPPWE